MRTLPGIVLCALLLAGCELLSSDGLEPISPSQRILFEIEYVNYAWGFRWEGLYVDNTGKVYTYQLETSDQRPEDKASYTEEELLTKYSHQQTTIAQIDSVTLSDRTALIPSALGGLLSEPASYCNDGGVVSFRTFRFDTTTMHYTPVMLKQEGDRRQENTAGSARLLVEWLRTLDVRFKNPICE